MGDTNHRTYVQTAGGLFYAGCEVEDATGFKTRDNYDEAEADAKAHGNFEPIATREELEAAAAAESERLSRSRG